MDCFITRTGSYLPGLPISNTDIPRYLGELSGESRVRDKVLYLNGIKQRHYALDEQQNATHDVYDLAALAAENCLAGNSNIRFSFLSAGTTNAPLIAPGIASIIHSRLKDRGLLDYSLEICSNSGICSSASQAMVHAIRAIQSKAHANALCIGAEQPSAILKSSVIQPVQDADEMTEDINKSKWFMSVFLRFMLSDGAGAFLLESRPAANSPSFRVNWTFSQSYAHEAPLCMQLDAASRLLSQDVTILTAQLVPCARKAVTLALQTHDDDLRSYAVVLPHLSSFYFKRKMQAVMAELTTGSSAQLAFWTNLASAGNTGAASIFIMLDQFCKTQKCTHGDKLLLFVPESGQFNFVIISLTVVLP